MMSRDPEPGVPKAAFERHYSPQEIAELWGLSADKVRRIFRNESGVLVIEGRHLTIRIPQSVAERVHRRLSKVV